MADPGRDLVPGTLPVSERCAALEHVAELVCQRSIETLDLKFVDLPGRWHHVSLPVERLDAALCRDGVAFDGSSVPGYADGGRSDMALLPDPRTAVLDPFWDRPTLNRRQHPREIGLYLDA